MSYDFEKRDLRIIKTEKALYEAMRTLLAGNIFRKITVRDICEEALVSRATFYSYYMDKYDLLHHWLAVITPKEMRVRNGYEEFSGIANQFVNTNKIIIRNIMEDADPETIDIVINYMLVLLDLPMLSPGNKKVDLQDVVISNLLAGGLMQYVLWHIKNKFPTELVNKYLYGIIYGVMEKYHKDQL